MGQVGLAGAFVGLDLLNNSTSVTFNPSTSSLLSRTSEGALTIIGSTNPGGSILSGCALDNIFYFAGSFSSIGNVSATNVASYTPSSGAFATLGANGPNGVVNALYCDASHNKLWAGGHFTSPSSAVAIWDTTTNSWAPPPFKGFTGAEAEVLSIAPNSSDSSLFFAGSFLTAFTANGLVMNNTNNPNVPYSPGATPFSSSLVPIPLQGAEIEGEPSSSNPQFGNIQNVLCPAGPDGPGNTWLAADGNSAQITVRAFSSISAYGVRLGNTFQSGYGTTGFSVTSIPDNTVQTLQYIDPTTGQNTTCTDPCPLSTDSGILYQDFLFANPVTLTGVLITLSEYTGAAPGLHILQLLSAGAFASAIANDNTQSCYAPDPSKITSTGTWTPKNANTNIPATLQTVLVSTVAVGTPSSQAPSFTWQPYVSASGQYDVNLVIPGCADFQDCALRTTVQVTVFPGDGSHYVTTVSQQNTNDVSTLIYSGPIVPTSPNFVTTVSMTLADNPAGDGQGGQYELVAGDVELVLTSANVNSASGATGNNATTGPGGTLNGFGFFEWPLNSNANVDASTILANSSETYLDMVGFSLYNALGATTSSSSVAAVLQHPSGIVFIGGDFQMTFGSILGTTNIVAFKNGNLVALPNNGLNGPVTSLELYGDYLFVGGSFTDTTSASNSRLRGVAMYDVKSNSWNALTEGVNGAVNQLALGAGQLQVAGNFSEVLSVTGASVADGGFATWDISTASWVNSGGFVVGNMTFVGNGTSPAKGQQQSQFVAGNVLTMATYGASGLVMLSNGNDGPTVTPLGVQLDSYANVSSVSSLKRRRNHIHRGPSAWMNHLSFRSLFSRQTSTNQPTPLPPPPSSPAPAVLTGVFWTNTSSSQELAIIGGNFSFSTATSPSAQGVAIYNSNGPTVAALQGSQVNGVVRTLLVEENKLFVGGEFTLNASSANGLAVYELTTQQWDSSTIPPLQPSSGSSAVVRSITTSTYKPNAIIIAGSFAKAGSAGCQGICLLDSSSYQWSVLGDGFQGEVSSVSYAGDNEELLIVAGSINLSGIGSTNVAQYSFTNASWTAVGTGADIPGPVTAVEVNNGNVSSIFAAGRSYDGSSAFIMFWNGVSWTSIDSTLQSTTNVSQLVMVPLQNTHLGNSIIESDRMLMISGALMDSSFGSASAALFDGVNWIPYITAVSTQGTLGLVSSLFYSFANFSFAQQHFLATGVVILISIAIAAGVVFLLALIGILWTLLSRRDDKLSKFDGANEEDDDSTRHRPSSLLEHINAATRTTILGTQSPFNNFNSEKGDAAPDLVADPFGPDGSNYLRAETPSDAVIGTLAAEEEFSRPAHARYSFDGAGEGELPLTAGLEVEILDDRDAAWWYARNVQSGREGVVPAAYLY
ncbi:cortical protein marker for cell polarity-domain-containing protein [Hygrophoropsis aurantiaca]|uniref:Cortical protein marker for cell polarity-domain-containing protein n=1 Tax=Hygrophoropsis aurantiaca TaxID=72124 RepID=A0ACB7ZXL9_9AGAM|nr:cortical protein marker for cell polarity-domain-containing protein [Hygrophoropsis aurantiaca]